MIRRPPRSPLFPSPTLFRSGVSTVVISLNGTPAVSQTVPDGDGMLQRTLPVGQQARASDFVRLGVNWRSRNGQVRCDDNRSEEHTSELQSPDHLVCRLLLEK